MGGARQATRPRSEGETCGRTSTPRRLLRLVITQPPSATPPNKDIDGKRKHVESSIRSKSDSNQSFTTTTYEASYDVLYIPPTSDRLCASATSASRRSTESRAAAEFSQAQRRPRTFPETDALTCAARAAEIAEFRAHEEQPQLSLRIHSCDRSLCDARGEHAT